MHDLPRSGPDRLSDLVEVLQAFRGLSHVFPVGTAVLFLKMVEHGGAVDLDRAARETGIPFSQVCRFAGNLSDGATRNVSGLDLARRDDRPGSRSGRYVLTDAGWALAARIGVSPEAAEALRAA
jgi:hypothetical protein